MRVFLITFIAVYGLLHLHFLVRAAKALRLSRWQVAMFSFFLLVMMLSPIGVRGLEQHGLEMPAIVLAWAGYIWMGVVFFFFSSSLIVECFRLFCWGIRKIFGLRIGAGILSDRNIFLLPLLLAIVTTAYGFFENQTIRTEEIRITSPKLKNGETIRLVQVSDIHLGLMVRNGRLAKIISAVRAARPDILVATGDLVDGQLDNIRGLADQFQDIKPRYGKFAVIGNHEFYAGLDHSLAFIEAAGFEILRDRNVMINDHLALAGVDDIRGHFPGQDLARAEALALAGSDAGYFTVLLKHRPLVEKGNFSRIDLQLSGHTHSGQLFPFSLATKLAFPWHSGLYEIEGGGRLYVTRGAGTWGPPIRVLAPPQITVFVLIGA